MRNSFLHVVITSSILALCDIRVVCSEPGNTTCGEKNESINDD